MNDIQILCEIRPPEVRNKHLHEADNAPGLLEAFVFFELPQQVGKAWMERVGLQYFRVNFLRRGGCQIHSDGLLQSVAVGIGHHTNLGLGGNLGEDALAQNVVKLIAIWIYRRDGNGRTTNFRGDVSPSLLE